MVFAEESKQSCASWREIPHTSQQYGLRHEQSQLRYYKFGPGKTTIFGHGYRRSAIHLRKSLRSQSRHATKYQCIAKINRDTRIEGKNIDVLEEKKLFILIAMPKVFSF